jgi:hypothetical protein
VEAFEHPHDTPPPYPFIPSPTFAHSSIVVGLLLCLEGVGHGKMSEIFWVGPFLAIAGGLWLVSDWFDF